MLKTSLFNSFQYVFVPLKYLRFKVFVHYASLGWCWHEDLILLQSV